MERSLIYRHIGLYRVVMNALYGGGYRRRFQQILDALGPFENPEPTLVEYCFGDTLLAEGCAARGIQWIGVDLNPDFCARARKHGLVVIEGDVLEIGVPKSDTAVMLGSLYHFHDRLDELFRRVLERSPRFLLSEPVQNLSSRQDLLGRVARRAANPGNGPAPFRFTEQTLLEALDKQSELLGLRYTVLARGRDLVVDIRR